MGEYLHDPAVSSPGERLRLLADECAHRRGVERHNRELRARFGLPSPDASEGGGVGA
jgi:hypothetical protein